MRKELWVKVQQSLQKNLSKPSYETWIRPAEFCSFQDGELILLAQSSFACAYLKNNYARTIEETAESIFGEPVKVTVRVKAQKKSNGSNNQDILNTGPLPQIPKAALNPRRDGAGTKKQLLNFS